jgi:hypothetical protein
VLIKVGRKKKEISPERDLGIGLGLDLEMFLCKVNKVTAAHRHGQKIPVRALDALSNAQIDIEAKLREGKNEIISSCRNHLNRTCVKTARCVQGGLSCFE